MFFQGESMVYEFTSRCAASDTWHIWRAPMRDTAVITTFRCWPCNEIILRRRLLRLEYLGECTRTDVAWPDDAVAMVMELVL